VIWPRESRAAVAKDCADEPEKATMSRVPVLIGENV
jgi:hypothetical protein